MPKLLTGWQKFYNVDEHGRVWSNRSGRYLKPSINADGYLVVRISVGVRNKLVYVHHLVLESYMGPRPFGKVCRHLNGNHADCRRVNLIWGTPAENELDKIVHGRTNRGCRNGNAKLQIGDVHMIRNSKGTQQEIASAFGVSRYTVSAIRSGKLWSHV